MTSIDIKTRFKYLKSPNVPFCLKACGDELLERAHLGQLKLLPECISSIVSHAIEDRKLNANKIEELISNFNTERKNLTSAQEDNRRIAECSKLSNDIIFAVLLEFLRRCRESLFVHLSYPRNGWIILGPPYSNNYEMVDESRFQKALTILLDMIYDEFPLKRDMLCYTMSILSQMVQIANENCRSQPALSAMVRYQMASLFAPILIGMRCDKCKCNFSEVAKPCDICSYIPNILQKPFEVDIMDRLLKHIPVQFWRNILNNIRTMALTDEKDDVIHKELTNYFQNGPPGKTKQTPEKMTKMVGTETKPAKTEKTTPKIEAEPKKQARGENKTPKSGKPQKQDAGKEAPQTKLRTPSIGRSSIIASQDEVDDIIDESDDDDGIDGKDGDNIDGDKEDDEGQANDQEDNGEEDMNKKEERQTAKVSQKTEPRLSKHSQGKQKTKDSQLKISKSEEKSKTKASKSTPSSSGKTKAAVEGSGGGPKKKTDRGQKKDAKIPEQTKMKSEPKSKPGSNKRARAAKIPNKSTKNKRS